MRGSSLLFFLLAVAFSGCVATVVRTGPEDEGPQVPIGEVASNLSLDSHDSPLSRILTLSNHANVVLLCPGIASIRVNDAVFPLPRPVIASSRGVFVPSGTEALIRSRLRTLPPKEPSTALEKAAPKRNPVKPWGGIRTPPIPRTWRVVANRKWTSIVIHHSATERGGARLFDKMHRQENGWKYGLGYHFVIGNGTDTADGQVEVGHRWRRQNEGIHGAHAGTDEYNQHGIGICLVGNFEKDRPTQKQLAALVKLVRKLSASYGISPSRIFKHQKVRPTHTDCPGRLFPMSRFLKALRPK